MALPSFTGLTDLSSSGTSEASAMGEPATQSWQEWLRAHGTSSLLATAGARASGAMVAMGGWQ
eukprot:13026778-Alexandrium_andersonii.AAC.1